MHMPRLHPVLVLFLLLTLGSACRKPVVGCIDPIYNNYDELANEDDGCCCTITGEPLGEWVDRDTMVPFPSMPGSVVSPPLIALHGVVLRKDQTAYGPCGCLDYSGQQDGLGWLYSDEAYNDGTYGPRRLCSTGITWTWHLAPGAVDSAEWGLIAAANGFEPESPFIRINYTMRFRSSVASPDFVRSFTDTLYSYFVYHTNTDPSTVHVKSNGATQLITGGDLPCSEYSVDSSVVTVDSLRFL